MSGMVEITMLADIAMRLAALSDALANGNSAAEQAASDLAAQAAALVEQLNRSRS